MFRSSIYFITVHSRISGVQPVTFIFLRAPAIGKIHLVIGETGVRESLSNSYSNITSQFALVHRTRKPFIILLPTLNCSRINSDAFIKFTADKQRIRLPFDEYITFISASSKRTVYRIV